MTIPLDADPEPMLLLDLRYRQLIRGDEAQQLTRAECLILGTLSRCGGSATYERLISALWDSDDEPTDAEKTLRVQLCKLRRKLRLRGWPPLIGTVWGNGLTLGGTLKVRDHNPPVVIPAELRSSLRRLLLSHSEQAAADRILLAVG